jgi:hypothetical protein
MRYEDMTAHNLGARLKTGDAGAIRYVRRALRDSGWEIKATAEALSVSRYSLYRWLGEPTMAELRREIGEKKAGS